MYKRGTKSEKGFFSYLTFSYNPWIYKRGLKVSVIEKKSYF